MSYIPDYVREYLDRFPETSGAQLAKALHLAGRSARRYVQHYRGLEEDSTDVRREALHEFLETSFTAKKVSFEGKTRTVVAVGDFHGDPDPHILAKIVEYRPHVIVFGGDTFDQLSASHWPSETKNQAKRRVKRQGRNELKAMRAAVEFLLGATDALIYIMLGNHDVRSVKLLLASMPDWILENYRDPIELLCEGLEDRVVLVDQTVDYTFPDGQIYHTDMSNEFVFVMGDVLFSHMNFTSSMTESACSKLHRKWFMYWERPLGLQHVNVLVQFHSHQRNMLTLSEGHLLLIEPGMAGSIDTEEYKFGYNGQWKPSTRGFLVLNQVENAGTWVTVPDSVELVAPYLT